MWYQLSKYNVITTTFHVNQVLLGILIVKTFHSNYKQCFAIACAPSPDFCDDPLTLKIPLLTQEFKCITTKMENLVVCLYSCAFQKYTKVALATTSYKKERKLISILSILRILWVYLDKKQRRRRREYPRRRHEKKSCTTIQNPARPEHTQ